MDDALAEVESWQPHQSPLQGTALHVYEFLARARQHPHLWNGPPEKRVRQVLERMLGRETSSSSVPSLQQLDQASTSLVCAYKAALHLALLSRQRNGLAKVNKLLSGDSGHS
jgi:hypothetical protein